MRLFLGSNSDSLIYSLPARRNSVMFRTGDRRYNYANLWRAGYLENADILACPAYGGGSSWANHMLSSSGLKLTHNKEKQV
jgi:hypothetical protein